MMRHLVAVMVLLAVGTLGCRGDPCLPGKKPTLKIGTGEELFVPLDEQDPEMELIHGPQGGYHLLVSLETTYLDAVATMDGTLTGSIDGEILATGRPWLQMVCNEERGTLQTWGTFLIYEAQPEELHGRMTRIDAIVKDYLGTEVEASTEVRIYDPWMAAGGEP